MIFVQILPVAFPKFAALKDVLNQRINLVKRKAVETFVTFTVCGVRGEGGAAVRGQAHARCSRGWGRGRPEGEGGAPAFPHLICKLHASCSRC